MSFLDRLIGVAAPFNCLHCAAEGSLLCRTCFSDLPSTPPFSHQTHYLSSAQAVTLYSGVAKDLVLQLKSHGAQAAASVMASGLSTLITGRHYLLVPAPTGTVHARQRGYDQARLLTRHLSRLTGLLYVDCLRRRGQAHQIGASRQLRLQQMNGAFYVKSPLGVNGATIILIDDVITTGATLESAAKVLLQAGAKEVRALTFAQA